MPQEDTLEHARILLPDNTSPNIDEALQSRIKDPLWFLARQWQGGELSAESGGRIAQTEVTWESYPIESLVRGDERVAVDRHDPLQWLVEDERLDGDPPAWRSEALEYGFEVETGDRVLAASEYDGRDLDWFHFDAAGSRTGATAGPNPSSRETRQRVVPTSLFFDGMPHPRWWRFEDADVFLDSAHDPEPNALSLLLTEFLYLDSNNWHVVPLEREVGFLHRITRVLVIDAFGVTAEVEPVARGGRGWNVFVLSTQPGATVVDGSYLFLPNISTAVHEGEVLEEVRFLRDEDANQVWAVERRVWDADEERAVNPADRRDPEPPAAVEPPEGLPAYRLRSEIPRHWIPYIPRLLREPGAAAGQMYLRRARSIESANRDDPQYRSQVVRESWKLNEEEIPRVGLRVQRLARFARGSQGRARFWIGRRRDLGSAERGAGSNFDFLDE